MSTRLRRGLEFGLGLIILIGLIWFNNLPSSDQPTPSPNPSATIEISSRGLPSSTPQQATSRPRQTAVATAKPTTRPRQTVMPTAKPTTRPRPSPTVAPTARATRTPERDSAGLRYVAFGDLPIQAQATIRLIEQGGPFPYSKDGAIFNNREQILPSKPRGYYREYTVETPGSADRGARRIVAGDNGELYYTDDHYASFRRVRQ
ncbi:ribonuclease domain-containing protein [Herpetosiphon sp.]|uniref:Guanine-specific ribonuclease N1 and T1 n=1 Tax=Herpetosiphon aurantiacus (strain ATCC 23779 / DSM 785 / 114-95) TaxID=316274 RepID=A9B1C4_HERA2|nr:ribonuclease domain-containing protein [Herpetosiphon sp.]ABX07311.1 guanine-specific ribonuclease N1 and T1 [Herpetosiphon aurantiacus DSM 785]